MCAAAAVATLGFSFVLVVERESFRVKCHDEWLQVSIGVSFDALIESMAG